MIEPIRDLEKLEQFKKELMKKNYRDYLLFKTGLNTGLRVSDVRTLIVDMIRDPHGTMKNHISIIEKKTGKTKVFVINPELKQELKDYTENMNAGEYIFKSRKGENKPLTNTQVWRIIKECAEKCGLENIATHTMRKSFSYHFIKQFNDIASLQLILNHSSSETTLSYAGIKQEEIDNKCVNLSL